MSKQIDERIVEMRFENAKFEKNVSQTMNTLDKLKQKLAFKNAEEGFDKIQKSANKLSFEHLVESVDNLQKTVLHRTGIIGGMFEELGSKIVNVFTNTFGKVQNMINQVTFEPIATGFSEYELKIDSVQTIAANTGVLMRDVMGSMNDSGKAMISTTEDLETAWQVMMGAYGNGAERVEALGDRYESVQSLVNQIVAGQIKMGDSIESTTSTLEGQEYTMEDIEKVLDDLNLYADKTIYNYGQMTNAIGRFTVAGVDLYDAQSNVIGLSNLAAFVGANAEDTARIMRELAQAMNTGYVSLMDWRSLINSSGFSGTVFQDNIESMANHMYASNEAYRAQMQAIHPWLAEVENQNEAITELIKHYGAFKDSLTQGEWFTTDVLTNTLHMFAGNWGDEMYEALGYTEEEIKNIQALGDVAFDAATKSKTFTQMWDAVTEAAQSSWTESWEYIFGHFYDARNLWTEIGDELSDVIGNMNKARNSALKLWASNPFGREKFLKGVANVWSFLKKTFTQVSKEWKRAMSSVNGRKLIKWSTQFYNLTKKLTGSEADEFVRKITTTVGKLFDILSKGGKTVKNILNSNLVKSITEIAKTLLSKSFKFLYDFFGAEGLKAKIKTIGDLIGGIFDIDFSEFTDSFATATESVINLITEFININEIIETSWNFIKDLPYKILMITVSVNELIKEFTGIDIFGLIKKIVEYMPIALENVKSAIESHNPLTLIKGLIDKVKENLEMLKSLLKKAKDYPGEVLKTVSEQISKFMTDLPDKAKNVLPFIQFIADALLIWEAYKGVNTFKKLGDGVQEFVETVSETVENIGESFSDMVDVLKEDSLARLITSISFALLSLAAVLLVLSKTPADELDHVLGVLIGIFLSMWAVFAILKKTMSAVPSATLEVMVGVFVGIGIAMLAISAAIAILAGLKDEDLAQAGVIIIGITRVLSILVKSFAHVKRAKYAASVAIGISFMLLSIIPLVTALGMIISLIKDGSVTPLTVIGAMTVLLILMGAIGGFMIMITQLTKLPTTWQGVAGIGALAISMIVFSAAIYAIIGAMDLIILALSTAKPGAVVGSVFVLVIIMGALGGIAFLIGQATKYVSKWTKVAAMGVVAGGMLVFALSVLTIAGAFTIILGAISTANMTGNGVAVAEAIGVFLLIVAALGAGMWFIVTYGKKIINPAAAKGIAAVAGVMFAIGIAVGILATSFIGILAAISAIGTKQDGSFEAAIITFIVVLIAIGALLAEMVGLTKLLPAGGTNATPLLVSALAIIAISKAVEIMANALVKLAALNYNDENTNKAINTFFSIILAISIIALLMGGVAALASRNFRFLSGNRFNLNIPNLQSLTGIGNVGRILQGAGIAILGVVGAVFLVIQSIKALIQIASDWDAENGRAKLSQVIIDICGAFSDAAPALKEMQHDANDLVMDFLFMLVEDILNAFGYLLDVLVAAATYLARSVVDILIGIFNGVAGTDLTTWYEVLGSDYLTEDMMSAFIQSAENAPINKLINALVATIALIIYGVGDAFVNNAGPIATAIGYFLASLGYLAFYTGGAILSIFMPEFDANTFDSYFSDFGQNFVDGWSTAWNTIILPALTKIGKLIVAGVISPFIGIAYSLVHTIAYFINSAVDSINDAFGTNLKPVSTAWFDDFYTEVYSYLGDVEEQTETARKAVDLTTESMQNFADTMDTLKDKTVESQIKMNPMFSTDTDEFNKKLFDAGNTGGKESVKGFNKAWDIHSPSVVGEQSGNDIGAGVVNGISGYFNSPEAQEKLSGIKDSLPKVDWSGLYDSDTSKFNLDPSQVFNLNTDSMGDDLMESGFGDIFSGMSLNMGNVSTDLADVNNFTQEISDALANEGGKFYDDTEVVNELNGLRTDIASLSRAMTQIKMYLDTNKLVGELVGPLDGALAQRASRAQRGN